MVLAQVSFGCSDFMLLQESKAGGAPAEAGAPFAQPQIPTGSGRNKENIDILTDYDRLLKTTGRTYVWLESLPVCTCYFF